VRFAPEAPAAQESGKKVARDLGNSKGEMWRFERILKRFNRNLHFFGILFNFKFT
jgi:hypothetical protein